MKLAPLLTVLASTALLRPAMAQLESYKDYDISEATSIVTAVKVKANMLDYYLEGLRDTWVASNDVAKSLGQIEGYNVYTSALPESGDFNLLLVVHFKSTGDIGPSKARYEAFMKAWGDSRQSQSRETVKTYPDVREITGDYMMNEITFRSSGASR
jgi:hypothetical protein